MVTSTKKLSAGFLKKRISLRPFTLSDVDAYMTLETDEKVLRFFTTKPLSTKQEALEQLKDNVIPHPWYRAICYHDSPIGYVYLDRGEGVNWSVGDITYCLSSLWWGRGIATFSIKLAVSAIFNEIKDLQTIEAYIVKENTGSRRVVQKVGFEEMCLFENYWYIKGETYDVIQYAILRDDITGMELEKLQTEITKMTINVQV
ncbi:hypothetical protein ACHQM5_014607 [Ranunculus cassubicifolius]